MMISMISFSGVTKVFDGREVLSDLTFQINPGEFVCITGPSGAGKSTILHLLIRAEVPTKGVIEVDGANIAMLPPPILQLYRQRTGVVFQDYKLLPDRTVEENIAFALEVCGLPDEEIAPKVASILERFELSDRAEAFPHELSGGEKTRAALGRALVHNPGILIADEPTGNIDPDQSQRILRYLKTIHSEGTTVILATHDKIVVDSLGVRVLRLENGKLVRDSVGGYLGGEAPAAPAASESVEVAPEGNAKAHHPRRSSSHHAPHHRKAAHHAEPEKQKEEPKEEEAPAPAKIKPVEEETQA